MLLNKQWVRGDWASKKQGRRRGPSWSRSWARRRPRRTRLLRQHYLVQKPKGHHVNMGSDQYELFLPAQSRQILRLPKFESQHKNDQQNSDLSPLKEGNLRLPNDNSVGEPFLQAPTNQRLYFPFTSRTQLLTRGIQRKKSETPFKARIIRVRRKKAVESMRPTEKRDDKVSTALDEFFPQTLFSKNQQKRKAKLSGQEQPLLDVVFPRSLFSENQYAKTKLNNQPE